MFELQFCRFCGTPFDSDEALHQHQLFFTHWWSDIRSPTAEYPCHTCDNLYFETQELAIAHSNLHDIYDARHFTYSWHNSLLGNPGAGADHERTVRRFTSFGQTHVPGSFGNLNSGTSSGGSKDRDTPPKPRGRRNDAEYEELKPSHSSAKAAWVKENPGTYEDSAMNDVMDMVGLEDVKAKFLSLRREIETAYNQGIPIKSERYGCVKLGNPGLDKIKVSQLYAQFLAQRRILEGTEVVETTGPSLASLGVEECRKHIENIHMRGGGILFIDEADQLTGNHDSSEGAEVLKYLLDQIEEKKGAVAIVIAGCSKQMEIFLGRNKGLSSRFPHKMQFNDYDDVDLARILALKVKEKWEGRMEVEKGPGGLYCRVVTRRIGRGRNGEGFENARAVENNLDQISQRQANRLGREQGRGRNRNNSTDVMMLTKEDLIGPHQSIALENCRAWVDLQALIGLKAVKDSVKALCMSIQANYDRELQEKPMIEFTLNSAFLGNPGTGKTSVAKLYGEILKHLGILSDGEVVVPKPYDFLGRYIGQSEAKTQAILASTVGKVLVIDEFYAFFSGDSGADSFRTGVIDTIVAEIQGVAGDDRCVLVLGYKEEMEKMFQNMNPGLSRRFPLQSAFVFDDFTDDELRQILELKLKTQGLQATKPAVEVAMEILRRARNQPHFGNAGAVDILLNDTKKRHIERITKIGPWVDSSTILEPQDFDPDHSRAGRLEETIGEMFKGMVGCEDIITKLESYQQRVKRMRMFNHDDPASHAPFSFIFRGPPGTGKTSTARKMGRIYYEMGILATPDVDECSPTDMIAEYLGQTTAKTRKLLERSLGKVLLIDEAYGLEWEHGYGYGKEAINTLVGCMTEDKFRQKLVIILAGYDADMNRLMQQNAGLSSRLPTTFDFRALDADECIELMCKEVEKFRDQITNKGKTVLDMHPLKKPSARFRETLIGRFDALGSLPDWGSARDIGTIAKEILYKADEVGGDSTRIYLRITERIILSEIDTMIAERRARAGLANLSFPIPYAGAAVSGWRRSAPSSGLKPREPQLSEVRRRSQDPLTDDRVSSGLKNSRWA